MPATRSKQPRVCWRGICATVHVLTADGDSTAQLQAVRLAVLFTEFHVCVSLLHEVFDLFTADNLPTTSVREATEHTSPAELWP